MAYPAEFEHWWAVYPKRKGKAEAFEQWRALDPSPALQLRLLAAVMAQAADPQWARDGGQFVPEAARWLRRRRWEDEPVVDDGVDEVTRQSRATMARIRKRCAEERAEAEKGNGNGNGNGHGPATATEEDYVYDGLRAIFGDATDPRPRVRKDAS